MAKHKIELRANKGMFRGLSNQNLLFHQALCELVDNAIAATPSSSKFRVDIVFERRDRHIIDVYVIDNCAGMDLHTLSRALELGESATVSNRLNEHGFGLKNSLATLSRSLGEWKLWTRSKGSAEIISVSGPFGPEMEIEDSDTFPDKTYLPTDSSTVIWVPVSLDFMQTVQGRGAPSSDLGNLRKWLIEHLGVAYRGYLDIDDQTGDNSGSIYVSIFSVSANDQKRVKAVRVPMAMQERHEIKDVEIGGSAYNLTYFIGTLNDGLRDVLVDGEKARYYYLGNRPTQGIDIRLGKRVIASAVLESIWRTEKGDSQLDRHNSYNSFTGELIIPELPRGVLSTVNNKTDFNIHDGDWKVIFDILNKTPEFRPIKEIRELTESELKNAWIKMLKSTNPDDTVTGERVVWPTGVKIDVFRKSANGKVTIYELKVGDGEPKHLYQLKMYWDGLNIENMEVHEAILMVEDYSSTLEEMANLMNTLPSKIGKPYNFRIEKLTDKGLISNKASRKSKR